MRIFRKIADLKNSLGDLKQTGFVPTMGALHEGHLSLVRRSIEQNTCSVVSVFVNPKQFNDASDLAKYPRNEAQDLELLEGVLGENDICFFPSLDEIYSDDLSSELNDFVIPEHLKNCLCGMTRPGHFEGVCEVISRLMGVFDSEIIINMYLGEKDYQQLKIVEALVEARFPNVEVVACPTIREPDGLAMSSRNQRLDKEGRQLALNLFKVLTNVADSLKKGDIFPDILQNQDKMIRQVLNEDLIELEYLEIRDAADLREVSSQTKIILVAAAINIAGLRLLDNVLLAWNNESF